MPVAAGKLAETQCGSYYFHLLPGAVTVPHVHPGYEEFYVLEGEACGKRRHGDQAGGFISFPPGSYHFTRSDKGCLLLVFEWRP